MLKWYGLQAPFYARDDLSESCLGSLVSISIDICLHWQLWLRSACNWTHNMRGLPIQRFMRLMHALCRKQTFLRI